MGNEGKICANCYKPIEEGDEHEYDGEYYCSSCYDNDFDDCYICGDRIPEDLLEWWGDVKLCPGCMEDQCPSCDPDDDSDTEEIYDKMCMDYLASKTIYDEAQTIPCSWDGAGDLALSYTAEITIDEDGYISDISKITCEVTLSESTTSSKRRAYPVNDYDYEYLIDEFIVPMLEDEDEDEE